MQKNSVKRSLKFIGLAALVTFAYWFANLVWFKPLSIDHFYERAFVRVLLKNPEALTQIGLLEGVGIRFHNAYLTDDSPGAQRWAHEYFKEQLDILRSYDREAQTDSQRLSTDILESHLADDVAREPFMFHGYAVTQINGAHISLPEFMLQIHPLTSNGDAEMYAARLSRFGKKFDDVIATLKEEESRGVLPPRFVVEAVLKICRDFIAVPPKENALYARFADKLAKVEAVTPAQREQVLVEVEKQITAAVYPAYRALIAHEEVALAKTTTDDGVWKLPNGDAFYKSQLRQQTTSDIAPAEVHELGLAEVARVGAEMKAEFAKLGYPDMPLADAVHKLAAEPSQRYTAGPDVRKEITGDYQKMIDEVNKRVAASFKVLPKAGVKVESVPEFREKNAPGAYYNAPSADGVRPGIFYANTGDLSRVLKYEMKTTAYHEAVPGHHFQISIQQEVKGVPQFRRFLGFGAYGEGWGLYAERLAAEIGMYENDPAGNIGRLQWELFRAVRLVVDSGIHYKHWTRQQAIDYMAQNTGNPIAEVVAEIERYIVWPGQATSYKVGQLKILALREKAKKELGAKFNLGEFHDVVLKNGSLPLAILEKLVDRYIAEKK